jgi:hypothetical protein
MSNSSLGAFRRVAQTPVLWGLRFPEGTCGSPRPTTRSRGPTEQVRATIDHLSRLVEQHAAGEYTRNAVCQVPGVRYQAPGAGAGAGRYEKLCASRFLPTALMRPSAPARD